MDDLRFRLAEPDDVAAVTALVERAYRGEVAATGWTTEADILTGPRTTEAQVRKLIEDQGTRFVLAERDGRLVGSALVQRAGTSAYLGMFAVDPAEQGRGLGKEVVGACERTARELWSSTTMTLTVISLRSELIDWYERRGYAPTGRHLPFPFHEASGALRTDFDLMELRKPL